MSDQQQSEQQPVFQIEKIYVRDMSLEIPHAPQVFLDRSQPEIDMQLRTNSTKIDEGYYENVLTVTVTAKAGDKTMFLAEASQAGIFQIRNVPEEDMSPILGIGCPNILFPYVRETISDMVNRAGFPPVILAPINFEVLYAQQQASNEQQAPAATH
ncbi:preprotein translocase subunit SecB [Chitinivorax tropicus]|uniref:Protein-export protein SecB n=1 Tax=Chitinivorax tropicus TaxID=714531 RepID=A0A840MSH9_9PROT|nr:protein-export chaperone SecB [Chitinivorax tropicus]MBB5018171.1 preprotein translocase subunit SecB [Chitinivorax tropicus]